MTGRLVLNLSCVGLNLLTLKCQYIRDVTSRNIPLVPCGYRLDDLCTWMYCLDIKARLLATFHNNNNWPLPVYTQNPWEPQRAFGRLGSAQIRPTDPLPWMYRAVSRKFFKAVTRGSPGGLPISNTKRLSMLWLGDLMAASKTKCMVLLQRNMYFMKLTFLPCLY